MLERLFLFRVLSRVNLLMMLWSAVVNLYVFWLLFIRFLRLGRLLQLFRLIRLHFDDKVASLDEDIFGVENRRI